MSVLCCCNGWNSAPVSERDSIYPWRAQEVTPHPIHGRRWEIVDSRTNLHYRGVPPVAISILSVLIIFATPIYLTGVVSWYLMKIVAKVALVAHQLISTWVDSILSLRPDLFLKITLQSVDDLFKDTLLNIWNIARSYFYAQLMIPAAALGIVSPYEGRKYLSMIENHWHQGASYRNDFRRVAEAAVGMTLWQALVNPNDPHVFYLAYCFQPLERSAETRS